MSALRQKLRVKLRYWTSRYPIADLVNRSRRACWADLVSWAQHKNRPLFGDDGTLNGERCRRESAEVGCCYCGKFQGGELP